MQEFADQDDPENLKFVRSLSFTSAHSEGPQPDVGEDSSDAEHQDHQSSSDAHSLVANYLADGDFRSKELLHREARSSEAAAEVLHELGSLLEDIFEGRIAPVRDVPPPSEGAAHRADMLLSVVSEELDAGRSLPVFVSCAESPAKVIATLLSVYHRRQRLPEPSEIYFCTGSSGSASLHESESVSLLIQRWAHAKKHGAGDRIFCVANIHNLTYTQQCVVVEDLRRCIAEYGTDNCATLLFLSGKARQVLMNTLASQMVDLTPLDDEELRQMCHAAINDHLGFTLSVRANVNGGGKSHYIMAQASLSL